jgi:inner membrane protein
MVADLDVFIRSSTDPTVSWVFHRHFTHSLIFIPIGGLLAALPFLFFKKFREDKAAVILASVIGYATHAPLDLLTSYGTQLFWPFSNYRAALDWIGIIDPVYTIPLATGVYLTARSLNPRPVRIALLLTTLYLCFGGWQHYRGVEFQKRLAASRGHQMQHSRVMPAPGWLLLWRSVYIADDRLYVDGFRLPWLLEPVVFEGGSAEVTTYEKLPASVQANSEARREFEILRWFSDGLMSPISEDLQTVGDQRFTAAVESLTPLWGLQFDPTTGAPRAWQPSSRQRRDFVGMLKTLVWGDPRYHQLK